MMAVLAMPECLLWLCFRGDESEWVLENTAGVGWSVEGVEWGMSREEKSEAVQKIL